jgi:hypothetical protein
MNMRMKEEKIGSLLWKFSLPAIIGMLVNALYNIVDRIFVGRGVGAIAIAATTVAFPHYDPDDGCGNAYWDWGHCFNIYSLRRTEKG